MVSGRSHVILTSDDCLKLEWRDGGVVWRKLNSGIPHTSQPFSDPPDFPSRHIPPPHVTSELSEGWGRKF